MDGSSALRKAELLSTMGAGVLGAGIALLLERWIAPAGFPLLMAGLVMHGFGMYQRRRIENEARRERPAWENLLYWGCWLVLAGVVVWAFAGR